MIPNIQKKKSPIIQEPPTKYPPNKTDVKLPKTLYDVTRTHVTKVTGKFYDNVGLVKIFYTYNSKSANSVMIAYGTGTLIASNIVLTCAHNVDLKGQKDIEIIKITFSPGITSLEESEDLMIQVRKKIFHYDYKISSSGVVSGPDIAILILEEPFHCERGYVSYKAMSDEELDGLYVTVVGYPADFAKKEKYLKEIKSSKKIEEIAEDFIPFMMKMDGKITKVTDKDILYRLKTTPGQSGAGVIHSLSDTEHILVGVHSKVLYDDIRSGTRITESILNFIEKIQVSHEITPQIPLNMSKKRQILQNKIEKINEKTSRIRKRAFDMHSNTYVIAEGAHGVVKCSIDFKRGNLKLARKIVTFSGNFARERLAMKEIGILLLIMEIQGKQDKESDMMTVYEIDYQPGKYFRALLEMGIGTLKNFIEFRAIEEEPFKKEEIIEIYKHLYFQIKKLRSVGIYHRDLKPSNIILSEKMILKITDFGIAEYIEPGKIEYGEFIAAGTDEYCPDVVQNALNQGKDKVMMNLWEGEKESLNKLMKKHFISEAFTLKDLKETIKTISLEELNPLIQDQSNSSSKFNPGKSSQYERFLNFRFKSILEQNDNQDLTLFFQMEKEKPEYCKSWFNVIIPKLRDYSREIKLKFMHEWLQFYESIESLEEAREQNEQFFKFFNDGTPVFEIEHKIRAIQIEQKILDVNNINQQNNDANIMCSILKINQLCTEALEIATKSLPINSEEIFYLTNIYECVEGILSLILNRS